MADLCFGDPRHPGAGLVKRKVNTLGVGRLFQLPVGIGYPHSVIEGVQQLEAGAWAKIKCGRITRTVYWDVTHLNNQHAVADFDFSDRRKVQEKIRQLMLP